MTAGLRVKDVRTSFLGLPEAGSRWYKTRLSWSMVARRIGAHCYTERRWEDGMACPNTKHITALLDQAESLGLRHIFTD